MSNVKQRCVNVPLAPGGPISATTSMAQRAVGPTPSRSRQETHFLQRRYPQSLMPLLSQIDRFFSSLGTIRLVTERAVEIGGGGGRIPLIAVTKHAMGVRGTTPSNHYSLLATIEDGFALPRLANAKGAATLFDLLPDFAEKHDAHVSTADGPTA